MVCDEITPEPTSFTLGLDYPPYLTSLRFCTQLGSAFSAAVLFCHSTVAVFVHGGTTAATIRHSMPRFPAPFLLTLPGLVGYGNATEGVLPYLRTSVWFNVALRSQKP